MIGIKEMTLITNAKKLAQKHKAEFSMFMNHDFYVRIYLVDEKTGLAAKVNEYIVNKDNWMEYVINANFSGYKIEKIEFSATGK